MAFGIASLTALVKMLDKKIDALTGEIVRLEMEIKKMAGTVADLDAALQKVADNETKLGQDLKTVIAALQAIPGVDLSPQIAVLNKVSDNLIQSDTDTLAALPPTP